MSRIFFLFCLLVIAAVAIVVSALNAAPVDIELAFARFSSPLGVALVVTFTLGMLAGLFWRLRWIAQLLRERGRLRRALRIAEDRLRTTNPAARTNKSPAPLE
jgi:uncharacterized integral membrane protein